MKTLTELKIVNTNYDLDSGFFWVEFENGKSIQCCLNQRKDLNGYKKEIDSDDNGCHWGLSGDNNEWALGEFQDYGEINSILCREARKRGIKII